MNILNVDDFLAEVTSSLKKYSLEYEIEFLIRTPKSLRANVYLKSNTFIALRYNARNERMDFALINNNQRIFGYDNLKKWHYHPLENPTKHIPCDKPTIDKIIFEIKEAYKIIKGE